MSEINKKESKLQTKKPFSDNDSEYASSYDESESVDEFPVRTRTPSKTTGKTAKQTDDIAPQPQDASGRSRRRRGVRSRSNRSRSRSQSRRARRTSRSRRRR